MQLGDAEDLMTLRTLCDDKGLGREALDAIKRLKTVSATSIKSAGRYIQTQQKPRSV